MELLDWKNQIPILTPNYITIINHKIPELVVIQILVVLRMWMFMNKLSHIDFLTCIVIENQLNRKVFEGTGLCYH